jgi:tRNA G18 (ribose-2'-O)-methylase SpoU
MPIVPIETLTDPRVAVYANMRDAELAQRQDPLDARAHAGVFIAEGELVVGRLIRSGFQVQSVLTTTQRLEAISKTLLGLAKDVPIYVAPQQVMNAIVGFNMHRGVLAIGVRQTILSLEALASRCSTIFVLEDLANHDNLGSIFRNAAALGGPGVGIVLSPRCADPLYRKSLRVSMGLVLAVPYTRAGSWPDSIQTLSRLGFQTWALTPRDNAVDIALATSASGPDAKIAMLLGSEGPGLSDAAFDAASHHVRIPMSPSAPFVDSLNVGVTAGIALYAVSAARNRLTT